MGIEVIDCDFGGCKLILPDAHTDNRGWYLEKYNEKIYNELGITDKFVQDNISFSKHKNTIRGMHWQDGDWAQSKLVSVLNGKVFDVVVDVRKDSPAYGKYFGVFLQGVNGYGQQFYIPKGFAHGFQTLTDDVVFSYKVNNFWNKESERGFRFDDPDVKIRWMIKDLGDPIISEKDLNHPMFKDI